MSALRIWGYRMKLSLVKSWIGRQIRWEEHYCPKAGYGLQRQGLLLQVRGRNLLVDQGGSIDWKWLPSLMHLRPVDAEQKQPEAD